MSVSEYLNSTIVVVAIDIDGLVAVTEVDAEQTGCIITYVVVVLDFQQVIRVRRLVLAVAEGMLILPRIARPEPLADEPDSRARPRPPAAPAPPLNGRLGGLAMSTPEEEDAASGANLHARRRS